MKPHVALAVALVTLLATAAFAAGEEAKVQQIELVNQITNPSLEPASDSARLPGWRSFGGQAPGEYRLDSEGYEGRRALFASGDKEGYHGGWLQTVSLQPNTEYRFSAWVKTEIEDGKVQYVRCDVYDKSQKENTIKNYHGYTAGSTTRSTNWTHFEKVFRTPDTVKTATIYPALLWGKSKAWVSDVRLVKRVRVAAEPIFQDDFAHTNLWELSSHLNGAPVAAQEAGPSHPSLSPQVAHEGKPSCRVAYDFATAAHDATMITRRDLKIEGAIVLRLQVHGDESGHTLFCVLTEASGEQHYAPIGHVIWTGWKTLNADLGLLRIPPRKHAVGPNHWGGDGNQILDDPITAITIGVNDKPDSSVGQGSVQFASLELLAAPATKEGK